MARELAHLAQSNFRARFRLNAKDRETAQTKGDALLRQHALEIITKRLAPAQSQLTRGLMLILTRYSPLPSSLPSDT